MQRSRHATDDRPMWSSPSQVARVLAIVYLLAVGAFVVYLSAYALFAHYVVPNRDDWRILDDMFSKPLLAWILTDQNGHLIPGTLALFFVDYIAFGGRMHLPVAASVLSFGIGLGALIVSLAPSHRPRDPLMLTTVGFAIFLFAWALGRHDLLWGLQGSVVFAATWTLISLAAFGVWVDDRRSHGASGRPQLLILSALSATAATFSQGIGISSWAGLLVAAAAARAPLRVLASLVACALGALLLYRSGLTTRPQLASMQLYSNLALSAPTYLLDHALAFIGTPLSDVLSSSGLLQRGPRYPLARLCGIVGGAVFVMAAIWAALRPAVFTRRHVLALGLATASLAGGVLVALNRVGFPNAMLHTRFSTWSSLFWIGLAATIPAQAASRRGAWLRLAGVLALALASGLTLPALGKALAAQADQLDEHAVLRSMHLLDIRWDRAASGNTIVPSPKRSYRLVERFRQDQTSIFRERVAQLPRTLLRDHVTFDQGDRCEGRVTSADRIPVRNESALLVSGWAVDRERDARIEHVVMTNAEGIVVGLGAAVRRTTKLLDVSLPDENFPWAGFIRGNFGRGPYKVFGLLGGNVACEFGVVTKRRPGREQRQSTDP